MITLLTLAAFAATAQAQDKQPAAAVQTMPLPHDLSPYGMFMAADIVVKAVMGGLLAASLITWIICIAKTLELSSSRRAVARGLRLVAHKGGANTGGRSASKYRGLLKTMQAHIDEEIVQTGASPGPGLLERVRSRFARIEHRASRSAMKGTGMLATIGSTAPFVGLFGTVWGIMNAFVGISQSQTTNLAVVAPGIAEALLATATGLVAAIPAVVIYNHLARQTAAYRAEIGDLSEVLLRNLSRDLETGRLSAGPSN